MPKHLQMLLVRGYWNQNAGNGNDLPGDKPSGNSKPNPESGNEPRKPTDEEAKLLKEVMEKKEKIKELTEQLNQVTGKLAEWDGLDIAEVKALIAEKQEIERKKLEAAGQWDALKKQMLDAHEAEKAKLSEQLSKVEAEKQALAQKIGELTVGNAFGHSAYIANELSWTPSKVRAVFGSHFEYDGDRVVGYDKPAGSANRALLVDAKGDPLPFDQALKKLVEADPDRDIMLKSKLANGANSSTTDKGVKPIETTNLSGVSKIAAGLRKL